jgi:C_GCAxxG_C_C family probable redox protein
VIHNFVLRGDNITNIVDSAKIYWFDENCSRTTACGILDFYDYKDASDVLFKSLTPFGEGLGERLICGSVIGSISALSYILSEKGLTKNEIEEQVDSFKTAFREEFGTIRCSELLYPELKLSDRYPKDPVRLDICTKTVEKAVLEVQKIVESLN